MTTTSAINTGATNSQARPDWRSWSTNDVPKLRFLLGPPRLVPGRVLPAFAVRIGTCAAAPEGSDTVTLSYGLVGSG